MKTQATPGETFMTLLKMGIFSEEQLIEQINNNMKNAYQNGLDIGYDQALFDVASEQITE